LAGPPCQGHSSLNNVSRNEDPRNRFYLHPVAIGIALGAKAIVIENVPGVRRDTSDVVKRAISLLTQYGYSITGDVLKAEQLGWPQTRHRYFLVAVKSGGVVPLSTLLDQLRSPVKPIEWAIHDLLDAHGSDVMTSESVLSAENQNRIQWLFDNDANHLPDEHRPACHRDKAHTYSSVYGRMSWDKPAGTITTGFSTPGRGRYIHPLRQRTLLPIEAARIQGFPDGYFTCPDSQKQINRSEIVKWVGDAVPAPLGYPAMICALHGLFNIDKFKLRQV
jgi:DNA (cytosine-5)-methyltransferase 1